MDNRFLMGVGLSLALSRIKICDVPELTIAWMIPAVVCTAETKTLYLHRHSVTHAPSGGCHSPKDAGHQGNDETSYAYRWCCSA